LTSSSETNAPCARTSFEVPGGGEQHVAAADECLGALAVEDGARVDLRCDLKRDARGEVGLDDAGDDVHRRTLRGDDEMDAGGARELREAGDVGFDLGGRDHHESASSSMTTTM